MSSRDPRSFQRASHPPAPRNRSPRFEPKSPWVLARARPVCDGPADVVFALDALRPRHTPSVSQKCRSGYMQIYNANSSFRSTCDLRSTSSLGSEGGEQSNNDSRRMTRLTLGLNWPPDGEIALSF